MSKKSNENNGMMTKVWGPAGWVFLHSCVMGYPVKIDKSNKEHRLRKKQTKLFFNNVGHILPCRYCRDSYNVFIKKLPITKFLNSRRNLAKWLYDIHNMVNNKLGTPKCDIPTFKDVYNRYDSYRADCRPTSKKDRENRLAKGCVVPKDGRKKRCLIKVVDVNEEGKRIYCNCKKSTKIKKRNRSNRSKGSKSRHRRSHKLNNV